MIDRNHALPITRQAELVGISRGNVYYLARAASEADLRLMKRIDALNLAHPFAGSRMLRDMLNREGFDVGRRHVATLMQRIAPRAHITGSGLVLAKRQKLDLVAEQRRLLAKLLLRDPGQLLAVPTPEAEIAVERIVASRDDLLDQARNSSGRQPVEFRA